LYSRLPVQLVVLADGDDELYRRFQETEWHVETHCYNYVAEMVTLNRCVTGWKWIGASIASRLKMPAGWVIREPLMMWRISPGRRPVPEKGTIALL
jgi:hypothetical protein